MATKNYFPFLTGVLFFVHFTTLYKTHTVITILKKDIIRIMHARNLPLFILYQVQDLSFDGPSIRLGPWITSKPLAVAVIGVGQTILAMEDVGKKFPKFESSHYCRRRLRRLCCCCLVK